MKSFSPSHHTLLLMSNDADFCKELAQRLELSEHGDFIASILRQWAIEREVVFNDRMRSFLSTNKRRQSNHND